MTPLSIAYLTYLYNPYNLTVQPRAFLRAPGTDIGECDLRAVLQQERLLVSYDLPDLLQTLEGSGIAVRASVIDLCLVGRLLYGRPYRGPRSRAPWSIWRLLEPATEDAAAIRQLREFTFERRAEPSSDDHLQWMRSMSLALEHLWTEQLVQLKDSGEERRLLEVELPVSKSLSNAQIRGLAVDQGRLEQRLTALDRQMGSASKALRERWSIMDPDDDCLVRTALERAGFSYVATLRTRSPDWALLELYEEYHELPRIILDYRRNRRDKNTLLRLGALGRPRIYPAFSALGTVTGRIVAEAPRLQFLKRRSRDVIAADPGMVLIYPDYSQFEPGIMADDSGDPLMIEDYNAGDLYTALAGALLGNASHRKSAKILFLAFCFGMSTEAMSRLVAESTNTPSSKAIDAISAFFGRYRALPKWRDSLRRELTSTGRIGTRLANFRYRDSEGPPTMDEERWMVSQRTQGTASLILKRLLLRLAKEVPEAEALLPMHDAVLMQVPEASFDRSRAMIERAFVDTFVEECPKIRPTVSFEPFAEPE